MKLYKVELKTVIVVVASSAVDAQGIAASSETQRDVVRDIGLETSHPTEIKDIGSLPYGWEGDFIPYGGDGDTTIDMLIGRIK